MRIRFYGRRWRKFDNFIIEFFKILVVIVIPLAIIAAIYTIKSGLIDKL